MNAHEISLGIGLGILFMCVVVTIIEIMRTRAPPKVWEDARQHYQARVNAYQARAELYDEAERAPFDVDNAKYAMDQRHKLSVGAAEHERFMRDTRAYLEQMDGVT